MSGPSYKFGEFELGRARFELKRNGRTLKLERIPGFGRALPGSREEDGTASRWPTLELKKILADQRVASSPLTVLDPHSSRPIPRLTRNTCPSGWRRCISRTFHGMSVGGEVTSNPAATHCLWTSSTS